MILSLLCLVTLQCNAVESSAQSIKKGKKNNTWLRNRDIAEQKGVPTYLSYTHFRLPAKELFRLCDVGLSLRWVVLRGRLVDDLACCPGDLLWV